MIGVVGSLVAFAVVLGIVLVVAVRPPVRRMTHAAEALRADLDARLGRLRDIRAARRARPAPAVDPASPVEPPAGSPGAVPVSTVPSGSSRTASPPAPADGHGRHRRVDHAP